MGSTKRGLNFINTNLGAQNARSLLNIYKEYNANVLITGGRNLYTALKVRIPFSDINREREFGYAGMLEMALTTHSPV